MEKHKVYQWKRRTHTRRGECILSPPLFAFTSISSSSSDVYVGNEKRSRPITWALDAMQRVEQRWKMQWKFVLPSLSVLRENERSWAKMCNKRFYWNESLFELPTFRSSSVYLAGKRLIKDSRKKTTEETDQDIKAIDDLGTFWTIERQQKICNRFGKWSKQSLWLPKN